MSPNARRAVVHVLRVAVTAAAVLFVVRMIRWNDYWIVEGPAPARPTYHELPEIVSVRGGAEGASLVTWANGRETTAVKVVRRQGFLSLFDQTNKPRFFAMMAATLIPMYLMARRWWLLLEGHGFEVPLGQIFFVTYAGAFFNNFLPGSVGGDLTKAILASSGEARKAAVAGTVILDRLIGLSVMILLGAVSLTPELGFYWSPAGDRRLVYLIYGLLGAMVLGYAVYFSRPFRALVGLLPFKRVVAELDGVFRSASDKKALVAKAAVLSLLAQASGILVIFGLATAMGIPGLSLVKFFIFEPIIFIVTALPISVGGWGVQEYVYQRLFGDFGGMDPNHAIALSVLYKLTLILASIPGGLLFAMGAARRRRAAAGTL